MQVVVDLFRKLLTSLQGASTGGSLAPDGVPGSNKMWSDKTYPHIGTGIHGVKALGQHDTSRMADLVRSEEWLDSHFPEGYTEDNEWIKDVWPHQASCVMT